MTRRSFFSVLSSALGVIAFWRPKPPSFRLDQKLLSDTLVALYKRQLGMPALLPSDVQRLFKRQSLSIDPVCEPPYLG